MATYAIGIRKDPRGRYGFSICDGRGSKVAGYNGCATRSRAEHLARGEAERLLPAMGTLFMAGAIATPMIRPESGVAGAVPLLLVSSLFFAASTWRVELAGALYRLSGSVEWRLFGIVFFAVSCALLLFGRWVFSDSAVSSKGKL